MRLMHSLILSFVTAYSYSTACPDRYPALKIEWIVCAFLWNNYTGIFHCKLVFYHWPAWHASTAAGTLSFNHISCVTCCYNCNVGNGCRCNSMGYVIGTKFRRQCIDTGKKKLDDLLYRICGHDAGYLFCNRCLAACIVAGYDTGSRVHRFCFCRQP